MTGDPTLALLHLDSVLYYKSEIEQIRDTRLKIQAEYKFQNERHFAEMQVLKTETIRQKWIRNFIIGILFLLMIVGILYTNRQRMKSAFKEQQLTLQKQKAESELATAQSQLDDFTKSLIEKNALIEKFSDEILKLQSLPCNVITPEQTETLNQLRMSAILTDEDWEEFRNRFEKVHAGFLHRLRLKIPDLSPAETRFMALAKLQLNNKEMGSILGISPDSIRTIRYRLRKKLKLSEEGEMEELVNSV
jgi:DNA-binding CsgD family transcriptional regulator